MPELPPLKTSAPKSPPVRNQKHLDWVREHMCCIRGCRNVGNIQAAHVRRGTDGGAGLKPGDNWTLSLCYPHHAEQHQRGEPAFEAKYNIKMKELAQEFWAQSPWRDK